MIDQYGRTIEYLRISVTDRCNLRCVYCMPEEGIEQLPHEQILTFDEIERVCRISTELGISKIKLTGGEPLVRKGLPDLLGKIKRVSGIEQVTLTTNGILLKNQLDELMRQGLDAVNISIDTLDETCYHTVTRCGELNQALEGLQVALEYPNLRVKLNCVPMNQSEEEYIQMAVGFCHDIHKWNDIFPKTLAEFFQKFFTIRSFLIHFIHKKKGRNVISF